jgi:hypothetical protein
MNGDKNKHKKQAASSGCNFGICTVHCKWAMGRWAGRARIRNGAVLGRPFAIFKGIGFLKSASCQTCR